MLAQELGMSRSAFFKKTKAVMGCSPSDMVKDFKLSHAVELLKHSGQSITDVAYCCGFTDVCLLYTSLAMTLAAQAEVKLPKIFGDNMVLQQQTECNLWGTADANKVVKVRAPWASA